MPDPMHGLEEELDRLYEGTVLPGPVVGPFAEDVHPAPTKGADVCPAPTQLCEETQLSPSAEAPLPGPAVGPGETAQFPDPPCRPQSTHSDTLDK